MGMVRQRTLGRRLKRMPAVSEAVADCVTRRCARRRISFRRRTNVKTPIPRRKLGVTSFKM
jgi:hypothetical protein